MTRPRPIRRFDRRLETLVSLASLVVFALSVAPLACATASSGTASCDDLCTGIADCGETTCLAQCVEIQSACTDKNQQGSFSDWANCHPYLTCGASGTYSSSTCVVEQIGLLSCGTTGVSTGPGSGGDAGIVTPRDGGADANPGNDSSGSGSGDDSADDSGDDSAFDSGDDSAFDSGDDSAFDSGDDEDAGVDSGFGGSGCSGLSSCCASLPSDEAESCNEIVSEGSDVDCSAELNVYEEDGLCN